MIITWTFCMMCPLYHAMSWLNEQMIMHNNCCRLALASRQSGSSFVLHRRRETAANPTAADGLRQKATFNLHRCDFKRSNGPHTICSSSLFGSRCLGALIGLVTVISLSQTSNDMAVTWGKIKVVTTRTAARFMWPSPSLAQRLTAVCNMCFYAE